MHDIAHYSESDSQCCIRSKNNRPYCALVTRLHCLFITAVNTYYFHQAPIFRIRIIQVWSELSCCMCCTSFVRRDSRLLSLCPNCWAACKQSTKISTESTLQLEGDLIKMLLPCTMYEIQKNRGLKHLHTRFTCFSRNLWEQGQHQASLKCFYMLPVEVRRSGASRQQPSSP